MMSSNLPAGCSDRDLPANRPEDLAIEQAIEKKKCEACSKYIEYEELCCCEHCKLAKIKCNKFFFQIEPDHAKILERLNDRAESEMSQ